jgi:hypothetical protein
LILLLLFSLSVRPSVSFVWKEEKNKQKPNKHFLLQKQTQTQKQKRKKGGSALLFSPGSGSPFGGPPVRWCKRQICTFSYTFRLLCFEALWSHSEATLFEKEKFR